MSGFKTKLYMDAVRAEWAVERESLLQRGFELPYLENGKIYLMSRDGIRALPNETENKISETK